ncbi:MAG TPA: tetratricopeptide repeat protein [Caldilineaceae bacterium]|nr:tetratricopeptide repeat protein [Caldilineaceae bacterium]
MAIAIANRLKSDQPGKSAVGRPAHGPLTMRATPAAPPLEKLSEAEFTQLVNAAFKSMHSVFALARSPLASSRLVMPLLVLDDTSPTADERGHALGLVLQWAVARLAPQPPQYPIGQFRPYDDPTWRDPHWWRYNILRHRYLEPLHPDDFIEGARFTETLMALTGISSPDTFFDQRNRAMREVVQRLCQQLATGDANDELQQLALDEIHRPLLSRPAAHALLGVAATFDDVFPRALLIQMAGAERLVDSETSLEYLISHRYLQSDQTAATLWLSPRLRAYVYALQARPKLSPRHRQAAAYYRQNHEPLRAATHFQLAGEWPAAAETLLQVSSELISELQTAELSQALLRFPASQLAPEQWRAVQVLLSDLFHMSGNQEEAIAACRQALKVSHSAAQQAPIFRRMGKLYEKHNRLHALGYYQQAAERFDPADTEFLELLRDRAWLYIYRKEWELARGDLDLALTQAPAPAGKIRGDLYDALAHLYHAQQEYATAIQYAQQALAMREETGDARRLAASHTNLGLIYNDMGEYQHAIAAYMEAMITYQHLGNRSLIAGTLLNIGMAYHLARRLLDAVSAYTESLALCEEIGLPLVRVRAHSNLAEALAELGHVEEARYHWMIGNQLSQEAGFAEQLAYYAELRSRFPVLAAGAAPEASARPPQGAQTATDLSPDERIVLNLIERSGQVTPKALQEAAHISKATATRRLTDLVARGLLEQAGQGRGTYYVLAKIAPAQPKSGETALLNQAVQDRLLGEQGMLRQRYGLLALGLVATPSQLVQRLVADFAQPPALADFFDLEELIEAFAGQPVDLVIAAGLASLHDQKTAPAIHWLWRREGAP